MARTALATQQTDDAGLTATYTAANVDGHTLDGDGDVLLHVKNGSGGSINVTVQTPHTEDGLAISDRVIAVGAGAERFIGRFPVSTYTRDEGVTDGGLVYVDFSAVTSVTVAALGV